MQGLIFFTVLIILLFVAGYYSLINLVRRIDGIEDYKPTLKETIVFTVLFYLAFNKIRKGRK